MQIKCLNLVGKITGGNLSAPQASPVLDASEREKELCQQLQQAKDTIARLQNELQQASDRETQLQMQIGSMRLNTIEPQLIRRLSFRTIVRGVTSLDNLLYVLLDAVSSEQIEVYDKDTYCQQRKLTVSGLGRPVDIAACSGHRCAYISDDRNDTVHKLPLPDGNTVTRWSVPGQPAGLSVTISLSLLVTCSRDRSIKEFHTDGTLLRQLQPRDPGYVITARHAVQLSSGQFVVCHGQLGDTLHRACLLNSGGRVVGTYGQAPGSDSQQMNQPYHLAVDRYGLVFVADYFNARVMLLSSLTTSMRKFIPCDQLRRSHLPLGKTERLHLDENKSRLYVAVNDTTVGGVGTVVVVGIEKSN